MIYSMLNYVDRLQQSFEMYFIQNVVMWYVKIILYWKRRSKNQKLRSESIFVLSSNLKYIWILWKKKFKI